MKKIISMFLIFVAILCIFTSCGETEKAEKKAEDYAVLEIYVYEASSMANHKAELSLVGKNVEDSDKVNTTKSITVDGQTWSAEYSKTTIGYTYNSRKDKYVYHEAGKEIDFGIDQNGKCVYYFFYNENYTAEKSNVKKLTRDECYETAINYLKTYVDDVETYTLMYESFDEIPNYDGVYRFILNRCINNIKTFDEIQVRISVYGDIISHRLDNAGEMKNNDVLNAHSIDTIREAAIIKLDSIYDNLKGTNVIEYKFNSEKAGLNSGALTRLQSGDYVMIFDVTVNITNKTTNVNSTERTSVAVYLD